MNKLLVVGVIGLFLGLACAPSITANVSKEQEFVEYTTEIYGLNGGKQAVKLTQQQAIEVEELFVSMREQLNATNSREEAVEIYNRAVVELDKYGLLGGLNVEQVQNLVIGNNRQRILPIGPNISQNMFCIFSGTANIRDEVPELQGFCAPIGPLFMFGGALGALIYAIGFEYLGFIIPILFGIPAFLNPFRFMNIVLSLFCSWNITSVGLKGVVQSYDALLMLGYSGLLFYSKGTYDSVNMHFLGFCLWFA